jgi:hypothetical protein
LFFSGLCISAQIFFFEHLHRKRKVSTFALANEGNGRYGRQPGEKKRGAGIWRETKSVLDLHSLLRAAQGEKS